MAAVAEAHPMGNFSISHYSRLTVEPEGIEYARRLMARVEGNGPLITRWLPLTSSATITVLGVAIAAQALMNAGILVIRLG